MLFIYFGSSICDVAMSVNISVGLYHNYIDKQKLVTRDYIFILFAQKQLNKLDFHKNRPC